jgi:hypothetical protein
LASQRRFYVTDQMARQLTDNAGSTSNSVVLRFTSASVLLLASFFAARKENQTLRCPSIVAQGRERSRTGTLLKITPCASFPRKACPELAEGRESTDVGPRASGGPGHQGELDSRFRGNDVTFDGAQRRICIWSRPKAALCQSSKGPEKMENTVLVATADGTGGASPRNSRLHVIKSPAT